MAKFKGSLNIATINSLKGFLDFYTVGDHTIVRTWPKNRGKSQTPASIPWQRIFANFMTCHKNLEGGGDIYIPHATTGREWTSRDYLMSTYYGKMKMPPGFLLDTRDPWPPPIPDPHQRLFVVTIPDAAYSIFSGVVLRWWRCPQGPNTIYTTYDPPTYHYQDFIRRRQKHITVPVYTPRNTPFTPFGTHDLDHPRYNRFATFFRQLSRRFYFFMVSWRATPGRYVSQSPWFVAEIKPGPGGGEFGATMLGPFPLNPNHLKYPDLPLGPYA